MHDGRISKPENSSPAQGSALWKKIVLELGLQPHPEGGYYREVFRSTHEVQARGAQRCAGTSIYYLLADNAWSAWHRIDADEVWYFHAGDPLVLYILAADGGLVTHQLGNPLQHGGSVFQATVPAGCWFAAEPAGMGEFSLVSCAVMPGFEFSGFQLATEADIAEATRRYGEGLRRLLKSS